MHAASTSPLQSPRPAAAETRAPGFGDARRTLPLTRARVAGVRVPSADDVAGLLTAQLPQDLSVQHKLLSGFLLHADSPLAMEGLGRSSLLNKRGVAAPGSRAGSARFAALRARRSVLVLADDRCPCPLRPRDGATAAR